MKLILGPVLVSSHSVLHRFIFLKAVVPIHFLYEEILSTSGLSRFVSHYSVCSTQTEPFCPLKMPHIFLWSFSSVECYLVEALPKWCDFSFLYTPWYLYHLYHLALYFRYLCFPVVHYYVHYPTWFILDLSSFPWQWLEFIEHLNIIIVMTLSFP